MKEKSVEILATLLKTTSEKVNSAIESDELETLVSEFKNNNQVFDAKEFATLKTNFRKEVVDNLKEEDIPEAFKAKAVGWKLEDMEKKLAKEYQFTDEFNGLTDLVSKIVTKAEKPVNKEEIQTLKQRIVEIEEEYGNKLAEKSKEFDSKVIADDFSKSLNTLGLDYEDEVLEKQASLFKAAFSGTHKIERQDGTTVVIKDGEVIKDSKLDPLPLKEVMLGVAKDYGFQLKSPDTGGHGGASSKSKNSLQGVSFEEYMDKIGVKPNTEASDKAYSEWSAANK